MSPFSTVTRSGRHLPKEVQTHISHENDLITKLQGVLGGVFSTHPLMIVQCVAE